MAWHNNYWSCSKFADWVRGTPKLSAGTSEEWEDWRERSRDKHSFRYWIAEEALDWVQDFVTWPATKWNNIRYYINNRWITRSHALTAHPRDIKPGDWCDVGNRFLPCLFNELVDFVEVETAWHHVAWDPAARKEFGTPWSRSVFRWRTWRSAAAGIAHLNWSAGLVMNEEYGVEPGDAKYGTPTPQAESAKEVLALYQWWTEVYPKRPDPMDASGWSKYCELNREHNNGHWFGSKTTPELEKMSKAAHKKLTKIEADYEKEDTEMMIRLIKVRNNLWT